MKIFNKLVRDKIPEIIEKDGCMPKVHILSEDDYLMELGKKLLEEVKEYHADKNLEELADILEVLHATCKAHGYTLEELEAKRREKAAERGGFEERLFLEYVEDSEDDKNGVVSDIKALKKWSKIPDHVQEMIVNNVFCKTCGATTITEYSIVDDPCGITLQGKCAKCGGSVARYIEDID